MEVKNDNGIKVILDKIPTITESWDGVHRSEDNVILLIENFESYDTDLVHNGDLMLNFTNEQAVEFAKQLIDCIVKNVDGDFIEKFPGIPPF